MPPRPAWTDPDERPQDDVSDSDKPSTSIHDAPSAPEPIARDVNDAFTTTKSAKQKRPNSEEKPTPHARRKRRKGRRATDGREKSYRYGNYDRYYGYRVGETMEDHRLEALRDEWFRGKRACDVGCNDGLFSLSLVGAFAPASCVCLDIDDDLVRAAQRKLEALRRHSAAQACAAERGEGEGALADAGQAFGGVEFRRANAVEFDFGNEKFDVILLLSVTKWIHLNFGDDGVKTVLRKCRDALVPGGSLIIEPQPWKSYKSTLRKKINGVPVLPDECKANLAAIEFRPDAFAAHLLGRDGGFASAERLRPAGTAAFDREIFRFIKHHH